MKRFVNRLAALERLRQVGRDRARELLSRALGREDECRNAREFAEQALDESDRTELPGRSADAGDWQRLWDWRAARRCKQLLAVEVERRATDAVAGAVEQYAQATGRYKALVRLRELRHQRWLGEVEHEELKFLDEVDRSRRLRDKKTEEE